MSTTVTQTQTGLEQPILRLRVDPAPVEKAPETVDPDANYKYKRFLPHFDPDERQPPLEPFEHVDPGLKALDDPTPRSFMDNATTFEELTPKLGSIVEGVQLNKLNDREKSQLALLVAQRGLVVFRNQDFLDESPEYMKDWASYYGRLHSHPTSGQPKGHPEIHLVYKSATAVLNYETTQRFTSSVWHSDVSYEEQPPGLTALMLFESPPSGGDTGYALMTEAYNRLSPSFAAYLETLSVLHSGVAQAEFSRSGKRGGVVKREPVENVHPLVRRHPVTGQKALYVNKQFSRHIIGLKEEESEAIMNLLYAHIAQGTDFQARVRWQPRTVVLWDNRVCNHTAIADFDPGTGRRHGARLTPQAERPTL